MAVNEWFNSKEIDRVHHFGPRLNRVAKKQLTYTNKDCISSKILSL